MVCRIFWKFKEKNYILTFAYLKQNEKNSLSVANLNFRSTGSLEGLNSVLNRSILKKPHFFRFVQCLRYHESRKANDMINLHNDDMPQSHFEPRHKKDRERNNKIKHYTDLLEKNAIDVEQFLEAMASGYDGVFKLFCQRK